MLSASEPCVPGALAERIVGGIAFELRFHHEFSRIFKIDRVISADIGGLDKGLPCYDYNASFLTSHMDG